VPYQLVLRFKAFADILHNTGWMKRHISAKKALQWQASIQKAIHSLTQNPNRWPEADEAHELGIDLRVLLHGRGRHIFRILFWIQEDTVHVLRVRHASQDRITADDL
jgi:plasmid stabilization system protein ParE